MVNSSLQAFLLAHLLQVSIAIGVAAVVIHLTSRRLPHFAFLVCMLALIKCLVPPLITSPAGLFTLHRSVAYAPQSEAFDAEALLRIEQSEACDGQVIGMPTADGIDGRAAISWSSIGSTAFVILGIWGGGAILFLFCAIRKYRWVTRIINSSSPAPREFREMAERLSETLGLRQRARILVSNENFGPACVGVLRPTLILPKTLVACWSMQRLEPVVAHELVHARRRDAVWGYLQFSAQIIWWFHPLVWWMGRRAQLLCERCCDEEVIAALRCSRAEYAESLVRVLELRSFCRPVPLCRAMSPAEITGQRLRGLSQRDVTVSSQTSRSIWCVALLLAATILPGMHWGSKSIPLQVETLADHVLRQHIDDALDADQWDTAIALLQPIVENNADDCTAIFFLGYALHSAGRLDEALQYHQRAANFKTLEPVATYNIACAFALKGEGDRAMEALRRAVSIGFLPSDELAADSDLLSLVNRADFAALDAGIAMRRRTISFKSLTDEKPEDETQTAGNRALSKSARTPRSTTSASLHVTIESTNRQVEFEGTLSMPGCTPIRTRVTSNPLPNGLFERVVECSIDGQAWALHRRELSKPSNSSVR